MTEAPIAVYCVIGSSYLKRLCQANVTVVYDEVLVVSFAIGMLRKDCAPNFPLNPKDKARFAFQESKNPSTITFISSADWLPYVRLPP